MGSVSRESLVVDAECDSRCGAKTLIELVDGWYRVGFSETLGDEMGNELCSVMVTNCTSESIGNDVAGAGEIV